MSASEDSPPLSALNNPFLDCGVLHGQPRILRIFCQGFVLLAVYFLLFEIGFSFRGRKLLNKNIVCCSFMPLIDTL